MKQRFKVPLEMEQRYALRASIPQPGSYTLPVVLNSGFNSQLGNYTAIMAKLEGYSFQFNRFKL